LKFCEELLRSASTFFLFLVEVLGLLAIHKVVAAGIVATPWIIAASATSGTTITAWERCVTPALSISVGIWRRLSAVAIACTVATILNWDKVRRTTSTFG
jgi:hypothetical protein